AGQPTEAVQGTVRALWSAGQASRADGFALAPHLVTPGSLPERRQAELFTGRVRGAFRTRCARPVPGPAGAADGRRPGVRSAVRDAGRALGGATDRHAPPHRLGGGPVDLPPP